MWNLNNQILGKGQPLSFPLTVIAIYIGQELADIQTAPTFREGEIGTLFGFNRAAPQTALQPHMRALRFPLVPLRRVCGIPEQFLVSATRVCTVG